jgi:molybdopterin-synthase adenylyltransferase
MFSHLSHLRNSERRFGMSDRFARQADLVPRHRLSEEHLTVIGTGAIGRLAALQLASVGVRKLTLIDFDQVEETNTTSQGYLRRQIGMPKVEATRQSILEIDPTIEVAAIQDRFRAKHPVSDAIFCCVDTISAREAIWRQVGSRTRFWCDGRMLGEVLRVLTVTELRGREHYPRTLFAQSEAQTGSCTSRATVYAAAIAAGLMVHEFTRWLRGLRTDSDLTVNLLAGEMTAA